LIGRQHGAGPPEVGEQQEEVEQRIRTRIGEDPRTAMIPRVNVEVNDGMAELRGVAPSEEVRRAAGEIANGTEGVREVRNLITVDPQGPTRAGNQGS
jgi:osmotically-inducible protein OsmY